MVNLKLHKGPEEAKLFSFGAVRGNFNVIFCVTKIPDRDNILYFEPPPVQKPLVFNCSTMLCQ